MAQLKIDDVVLGEVSEDFARHMKELAQATPGHMQSYPEISMSRQDDVRELPPSLLHDSYYQEITSHYAMELRMEFHPQRTVTIPKWAR